MKVRVAFTIDVDPQAWEANYGVPASDPGAIRRDVQTYVENGARDHMRDLGLLKEASV